VFSLRGIDRVSKAQSIINSVSRIFVSVCVSIMLLSLIFVSFKIRVETQLGYVKVSLERSELSNKVINICFDTSIMFVVSILLSALAEASPKFSIKILLHIISIILSLFAIYYFMNSIYLIAVKSIRG